MDSDSFTCNRFDYFPGFSMNGMFSWPFDLQFCTVRERYYILSHLQTKLRELFV